MSKALLLSFQLSPFQRHRVPDSSGFITVTRFLSVDYEKLQKLLVLFIELCYNVC